jgi:response regulator of citrate/malate metabolism
MARGAMDILLIEDNPGAVRLLQEMLDIAQNFPHKLEDASCLADGLACLIGSPVDVVLLDLFLPDSLGVATTSCRSCQQCSIVL